MQEITGYRIGTVSPFGLPRPIRILIDTGVLDESEISVEAGIPKTGIILSSADLVQALTEVDKFRTVYYSIPVDNIIIIGNHETL